MYLNFLRMLLFKKNNYDSLAYNPPGIAVSPPNK